MLCWETDVGDSGCQHEDVIYFSLIQKICQKFQKQIDILVIVRYLAKSRSTGLELVES